MRGMGDVAPVLQPGQQQGNGGNQGADWGEDFFIYTAAFGTLAPAAQGIQNIQVQADSNFEWIMSTVFATMNGATAPFGDNICIPVNIQITDSGSGRALFSAPLPASSMAGNGKQPFILPVSRLFMARSNISVSATNFDPANTYNFITLNFIGRKLFKLGPNNNG